MPDRQVDMTALGAPSEVVSDNKVFAIPQLPSPLRSTMAWSWGIMVNALGGMNTDYRSGPDTSGDPQNC